MRSSPRDGLMTTTVPPPSARRGRLRRGRVVLRNRIPTWPRPTSSDSMRRASAATCPHVEPVAVVLDRGRVGLQIQHVGDAPAERMSGHQRSLGVGLSPGERRGEFGLSERISQPGVDQVLLHAPRGRACPATPRSPSRCPGSPTAVWPRSPPRSRGRAPRADRRRPPPTPGRSAARCRRSRVRRCPSTRFAASRPDRRGASGRSAPSAHTSPALTCESKNVASSRADDDVGFVDEVERARGAHALHGAHDGLPHLLPLRAQ